MPRISSEKAVAKIGNRYDLVLLASERAREIKRGEPSKIETDTGPVLTALKEIEEGLITKTYISKPFSNKR
jgi:DNA-directed RNA polymerase subunit omega